jgi:signal transduction histidine kinase
MVIFETIIINVIFILFPMFCYFLFVIYQRTFGKSVSDVLFDLALYSSIYLIIRYTDAFLTLKTVLIFIPLLISYLKKRKETAIIISIIIYYYYFSLGADLYLLTLEFVSYFILILIIKNRGLSNLKQFNLFAIIKIFFLFVNIYQLNDLIIKNKPLIIDLFLLSIIFYVVTSFILKMLNKCEEVSNFYITVIELEKEKQLRDSLFKITHEIKNPIAVCKGYLDMIDLEDKKKLKKFLEIIKQEINQVIPSLTV